LILQPFNLFEKSEGRFPGAKRVGAAGANPDFKHVEHRYGFH
jgi:hypothetical protein